VSLRACLAAAACAGTIASASANPADDAARCGVDVDRYLQPPTPYLCDALRVIEERAHAIGTVDWPRIKREVLAETRNARSESDVHPAIATALGSLDPHSRLLPPARAAELRSAQARLDRVQPNSETAIAYVDLRGFRGTDPASMLAYVSALREGIAAAEAGRTCGYIVDLRRNPGGNMWPALLALQPLLGTGIVGGFRTRDGREAWWQLEPDHASAADVVAIASRVPLPRVDTAAVRPVAVLLGTETASAGEAVAIAFRQRPATRFFGWHTAGLTTANATFPLPDRAALILAVADLVDRDGNAYSRYVVPDEETVAALRVHRLHRYDDVTRSAAAAWLGSTPACAAAVQ
jgi:C-terminal processing protease CtpA/Prc